MVHNRSLTISVDTVTEAYRLWFTIEIYPPLLLLKLIHPGLHENPVHPGLTLNLIRPGCYLKLVHPTPLLRKGPLHVGGQAGGLTAQLLSVRQLQLLLLILHLELVVVWRPGKSPQSLTDLLSA